MPQADLFYTDDLDLDAVGVLRAVEQAIKARDESAGACKGRAVPVAQFHHSHVLLRVAVLEKPHRDAPFRAAMVAELIRVLDGLLPAGCQRAVELRFLSPDYISGPVPSKNL